MDDIYRFAVGRTSMTRGAFLELAIVLQEVVLSAYLRDTDRAMTLDADGCYHAAPPDTEVRVDAQDTLLQHYTQRPE